MDSHGATCHCPCHRAVPVLVVLFGLTFLLGALNVLSMHAVSIIWPIILILIGIKKLVRCGCCGAAKPPMQG